MCGIIAFNGVENFDVEKIKVLFLFNESRGGDACGMYNDNKIIKTTEISYTALTKWNIVPEKSFIGHTRKATYATYKDVKNAHPFLAGKIVGVHNGTLTNHWQICANFGEKSSTSETDSEVLFKMINNDVNCLKHIKGAASIVYKNIEEDYDVLYCFRKNDDRPLWRGNLKEGMYISSMKESLEYIGCTKVEEFKTKCLYIIKDGKIITTKLMADYEEKPKHIKRGHSNVPALSYGYQDVDEYDGYTNYSEYGGSYAARQIQREEDFAKKVVDTKNFQAKDTWIRIVQKDETCERKDIKVGEYYQLATSWTSKNPFVELRTLRNLAGGVNPSIYFRFLYDATMVTPLPVKADHFAIAMKDSSGVRKGDIVHVSNFYYIQEDVGKATYKVIYPYNRKRTDEDEITTYFDSCGALRGASRAEVLDAYIATGIKLKVVAEYLSKGGIEIPALDKIMNVEPKQEKITSLDKIEFANSIEDVRDRLKTIETLSIEKAREILIKMKNKMDKDTGCIAAFNEILKEFISDKNTTSTEKEEEDIEAEIDADTPVDAAIEVINEAMAEPDETEVYNTIIQVGDDYEDLKLLASKAMTAKIRLYELNTAVDNPPIMIDQEGVKGYMKQLQEECDDVVLETTDVLDDFITFVANYKEKIIGELEAMEEQPISKEK